MKKDYVDQLNKVFAVQEQILDIQPFLEENENRDLGEVMGGRRWLKSFLSEGDFYYMVRQEWKEGFARLIENQIRRRMGLRKTSGVKNNLSIGWCSMSMGQISSSTWEDGHPNC
jgi:hypothetical protein